MNEFNCGNKSCANSCSVSLHIISKEPNKCLMTGEDQKWEKVFKPVKEPASAAKPEPLLELTADVFNRPDCPEWAKYAAVDSEGNAQWFEKEPHATIEYDYYSEHSGYWDSFGKEKDIPGIYDYGNWKGSLIKNPYFKMTVRFKKLHPDAKAPYLGTPGSAGWDLTAISKEEIGTFHTKYSTGLAMEIPEGHVGLVFPRSSVYKTELLLSNCVGVIDSDYRGEITAVFAGRGDKVYNVGDRIMQMIVMPFPAVEYVEVDELTETERGAGGYGSTGK